MTLDPSDGQVSIFDTATYPIPAGSVCAGELIEIHSDIPIHSISFSRNVSKLNTPTEMASEAIERAGEHADPEWKAEALQAVLVLCQNRSEFNGDDVWESLEGSDAHTREPRALGAILRQAAAKGWCRVTERVQVSRRSINHGRRISIWQSLLFQ